MKKTLSAALAILLAIGMLSFMAATVNATQEGDYTYEVANGEATITGYTGSGGDVTIPSTLGGCPVTKIGDGTFRGDNSLISVRIPSSVTSIGADAFWGCCKLTNARIPDSVVSIGEEAFYDCPLWNVTIPKSVKTIGAHAIGFEGGRSIYTKISALTLFCYKNTAGQTYAKNYGFAYELLDGTGFENFWRALANIFRIFFNNYFHI